MAEDVETAEVEEELDLTPDEDETTEDTQEEPEAEETTETEQEAESPETDEAQPGTPDVALQRVQQRVSSQQQQLDDISENLKGLTEAIKGQGGEATKEQADEVEQITDDVSKVLEGIADDDLIEGSQLKGILKQLGTVRQAPDIDKLVDDKLAERDQKLAEKQREQRELARQFEKRFDTDHPGLKGQSGDLIEQAEKVMSEKYGHLSQSTQDELWREEVWPTVVAEAEASTTGTKKAPKRQEPAKKTPPSPAEGASTKPKGAAANRMAGDGQYLDESDDDTIPDLETDD